MNLHDQVMVATGPYALKHGEIVDIPTGFEHPLVRVRFFGAGGQLLASTTDLVNVNRLCNFGAWRKHLTPRQQARAEK